MKRFYRFVRQTSFIKVCQTYVSPVISIVQRILKKLVGKFIHHQHTLALGLLLFLLIAQLTLMHLYMIFLRKVFQRLHISHVLVLHHKVHRTSCLATPETLIDPFRP